MQFQQIQILWKMKKSKQGCRYIYIFLSLFKSLGKRRQAKNPAAHHRTPETQARSAASGSALPWPCRGNPFPKDKVSSSSELLPFVGYQTKKVGYLDLQGKYFMLRVSEKNSSDRTHGFETPSRGACRHLFRCCIDHQAFFRLMATGPPPLSPYSRFRSYSPPLTGTNTLGLTEKQQVCFINFFSVLTQCARADLFSGRERDLHW